MIINQLALKRHVTVLVLVIIIVLAGLSSYFSLPRESDPDINIPYIFVTTTYEGVAPVDMEKLVTIPLERKLKGLDGLEEITSMSGDGLSSITLEFAPSVDIDDALQKVRDKVDQAKGDLPDDLDDDPLVKEMNFSDFPIIRVVLSGPFSLKRLKTFAEQFEDRFEAIPGVLDAEILGGLDREIHVEFDLDRLQGLRVPVSSVTAALSGGNVNMPGGSVDIGDAKYLVRVPADFKHPSEINSIVAFVKDGKPIYLRDVARIEDSYKDPTTISRINGQDAVTIAIKKRSGENIIDIVDETHRIIADMRQQLPPSLIIDTTGDQARDIRLMVKDLENNILTGLLLVLVVVFAFIGGRSAVFVALSIPLSMLITFAMLQAFGITLNMVVLFSLTLALGMLVDNGIVIVENVYRHMQEGMTRMEAARVAVDEVAWPVITSTLTTVGAFIPMIFWPGIMGEFMSFLPKTVIIALMASLFVALVVNPVLSARFQTIKVGDRHPDEIDEANLGRVLRFYRAMLRWALRHRLAVIGLSFAMLVGSAVAFGMFGKGVEFFPDIEPKQATVTIDAPVGTNLDASDRLVRQVERIIADGGHKDIQSVISTVGDGTYGTHKSELTIDFVDFAERERNSFDIIRELRETINATLGGAEYLVERRKEGPPSGAAVNMEIYGDDIAVLGGLVEQTRKIMSGVAGVVDLKDDFVEGKPEIRVDVDKEKAAMLGLDAASVGTTVKTAVAGAKVGVYREGKDEYDILAKLPDAAVSSLEGIRRITVPGPDGDPVPLTSLAEVRIGSGYGAINHKDLKRVVTVSSDVSGRLANEVIAEITAKLSHVEFPRGYSWQFTGEQEEQAKAQAFLGKAFIAAVFFIFLVLVTQFNSAAVPFIILTSVILSFIGVFLGLLVTGRPFGVIMTGIGVISLAGVVVNNAIVLIDYFEQLKARGMEATEALITTGLTRFRPVLLTAITTLLGLLPMATGVSFDFIGFRLEVGSESSMWWGSMAVAVIFGLGVATMLTLIVVPVLCSLRESAAAWATRREARSRERKAKPAQTALNTRGA
ncbi:efflux RND transporter permease subunit [Desulfocurvibacter africanus]|uniref:Acriflavin resistance protein n=1 Tax=Desulfocurvibacter africanus subsp. africanus str. Walvis Bay TaxID=690850 RepID=F3Z384_DESAF|nr:efflux RND transporter permease subunit [Desulfocurvibacter africanus]EGJ50328.1 acriflavin resistance protein [Desulfocurvibacter africanus subsp. africanus str. Walvis Bay]